MSSTPLTEQDLAAVAALPPFEVPGEDLTAVGVQAWGAVEAHLDGHEEAP